MDISDILNSDMKFRYMMLDRLRTDCEYYLGNGNRSKNHLWAGEEREQIACMKAIWESFSEKDKPEWLPYEKIMDYEKQMVRAAEHSITRSSGLDIGRGYIIGGGVNGFTKELDDIITKEAELLRDHFNADVTIRFNSDRLSGGAWLVDSPVDSYNSNNSVGLGAALMNSELMAMPLDKIIELPHGKFEELRRSPDSISFSTAINLSKTIHSVSLDSEAISSNYEYRNFDTIEAAADYLFSHVVGLKGKSPLSQQIQSAENKTSPVPHYTSRKNREPEL